MVGVDQVRDIGFCIHEDSAFKHRLAPRVHMEPASEVRQILVVTVTPGPTRCRLVPSSGDKSRELGEGHPFTPAYLVPKRHGSTDHDIPVEIVAMPGDSVELSLDIPSIGRASADAIFGAYVRVADDDDDMDNLDWLMSEEVAEESPEVPIVDDVDDSGDAGPMESVRFLHPPKAYFVGDSSCLVLTALAAEGDSPQKLGEVDLALVSDDSEQEFDLQTVPPLWSATYSASRLVAGKLVVCFRPGPQQCEAWWSLESASLRVNVSVLDEGVEPVHEIIPIDPGVRRAVLAACDQTVVEIGGNAESFD